MSLTKILLEQGYTHSFIYILPMTAFMTQHQRWIVVAGSSMSKIFIPLPFTEDIYDLCSKWKMENHNSNPLFITPEKVTLVANEYTSAFKLMGESLPSHLSFPVSPFVINILNPGYTQLLLGPRTWCSSTLNFWSCSCLPGALFPSASSPAHLLAKSCSSPGLGDCLLVCKLDFLPCQWPLTLIVPNSLGLNPTAHTEIDCSLVCILYPEMVF